MLNYSAAVSCLQVSVICILSYLHCLILFNIYSTCQVLHSLTVIFTLGQEKSGPVSKQQRLAPVHMTSTHDSSVGISDTSIDIYIVAYQYPQKGRSYWNQTLAVQHSEYTRPDPFFKVRVFNPCLPGALVSTKALVGN